MLRFLRAVDRFHRWTGRIAGWMVLAMVLIGAGNAVLRYVSRFAGKSLGSNAYLEAQWYLFSLVFLFGAAWTLATDRHVRVDVLYGRLGARARAWIDLVGGVVFLLPFCGFAIWVLLPSVIESWRVWEQSPDAGGLPRWPLKTAALAAFASLALQGVAEVVRRVLFLTGRLASLDVDVRDGHREGHV
ncbi:MAG: TRAP transporter small permease subunit [Planctomycetota bacterium]